MLSFTCATCHKHLKVQATLAGKKVKCPGCGHAVLVPQAVPASGQPPSSSGSKSGSSVRTLPSGVKPPRGHDQPTPSSPSNLDVTTGMEGGGDASLTDFLAPPQAADELGRLGKYRILKVLGRGGMGVVYQAEDLNLKRRVALKAMLPTVAASASAGKRFLREAQAMAAVEHDHIVRIYQVDEDRGVPFLAMEFLKGEPLDQLLARKETLPLPDVLRLGREIAEALAAAHATGLIHRDIKPANIWLEDRHVGTGKEGDSLHGQTAVLGATPGAHGPRAKILDFGLARSTADDTVLTQQGAIIGTPAYMAPEQAIGEAVDHRCDLFSLGCVLYRMATGELPFKGKDTLSILSALALTTPRPPLQLDPGLPPALSDLIVQLLAKKPEGRPANAQAVADALRAIEAGGEPVRRGVLPAPRKRRRMLLAGAGALVLAALALVVTFVIIRDPAGKEGRDGPEGGPGATAKPNGPAISSLPPADGAGLGPFEPGKPLGPLALVTQPARLPGVQSWTIETRDARLGERTIAYRPDGKRVAAAGADGVIRVWEPDTGKLVLVLHGHQHQVTSLAWSPDSKTLASIGQDASVRLWAADSGRRLKTLREKGTPTYVANATVFWTPDGKQVASWIEADAVVFWDVGTGKAARRLTKLGSWPALSPDGKVLACIGKDRIASLNRFVVLFDAATGKEVRQLTAGEKPLSYLSPAWSRMGDRVAAAGPDGVFVWFPVTGKEVFRHKQGSGPVAWSPNAQTLAVNLGTNRGIVLLDVAADPRPRVLEHFGESLLAWSPDGNQVARVNGQTVALHDVKTGKQLRRLSEAPLPAAATEIGWSADGKNLWTWQTGAGTRIVSADTGKQITVIPDAKIRAKSSPDGKMGATLEGNGVVLRDAAGKAPRTLPTGKTEALAWSPDSKQLAILAADRKTLGLWEVATGKRTGEIGPFPAGIDPTPSPAWLPDGNLLVFRVHNAGWCLWDLAQNKSMNDPKQWNSLRVTVAPDGKTVAVEDGSGVQLRDPASGKELAKLARGTRQSYHQPATWSPDGKLLAVDWGLTIELWDPASGRRLRTLHTGWATYTQGLAWSPDGTLLAAASATVVKLWEPATGQLRGSILPLPAWHGLTLTADGQFRGDQAVERAVVMVVRKDDGATEVLEPAFFERQYARKVDPDQVHLLRPLPPPLIVPEGAPLSPLVLVQEPAEIQGVRSWTIETRRPRGETRDIAYRPGGKHVACASTDGSIRLYDVQSGDVVRVFVGPRAERLSWSRDGKILAASSINEPGRLWDAETGRALRLLPDRGLAAWSPAQEILALHLSDTLRLWRPGTGEILRTHKFPTTIGSFAWAPDGRTIAVVNQKSVRLWDPATGKERLTTTPQPTDIRAVAWSPDSMQLATTGLGTDRLTRVWDAATGKLRYQFEIDSKFRTLTSALSWSPDGKALIIGFSQEPIGLFDTATGSVLQKFTGSGPVATAAWSPDGKQVVLGGPGCRLFDAVTGVLIHTLEDFQSDDPYAAWSPDGRALAIGQRGSQVAEVRTGRMRFPAVPDFFRGWSADSTWIAAVGKDSLLHLLEATTGKEKRVLEGTTGSYYRLHLACAPDHKVLAGGSIKTITAWQVATGKQLWKRTDLKGESGALAWSPDGRHLAAIETGAGAAVQLWSAAGERGQRLAGNVRCLAWSPDGKTLAGGGDHVVILWDADQGRELDKRKVALSWIDALAWPPDGKTLVSCTRTETAAWDAAGKRLLTFPTLDGRPFLAPGGGTLAVQTFTVSLYDVPTGRPLGVLVPDPAYAGLAVRSDGHFTGAPRVEREVVVVLQKADGTSETLSVADFERRYGWKNDPAKVRLVR